VYILGIRKYKNWEIEKPPQDLRGNSQRGILRKQPTKTELLDAIKDSNGIISTIAKRLNVSWDTARKYIKKDADAVQAYENERNGVLDLAENVIIDALQKNDISTAKWILQIKGKSRGYAGTDADTLDDPLFKSNFF